MKRLTAEELQMMLVKRRDLLETAMNGSAEKHQAQARKIESRIVARVTAADTAATPEARARVLSEVRAILGNGLKEALGQSEVDLLQTLELSLKTSAEYLTKADVLGGAYTGPSSRRAVETFKNLDERIRNRQILGDPNMVEVRSQWAKQWNVHWDALSDDLRRRMTRAAITGETINSIASGLVVDLGKLGVAGYQDPEAWAKSFVRTTQMQLYTDMSVALSREAGIEKFVNVGVSDERQSLECYEASQEPPKTMEEWDEWRASNGRGGRPGYRHVRNCRCVAGPVPPGLEDEDWAQPSEKFAEVASV